MKTGTNMSQEDYLKLKADAESLLTDAEAKERINKEFGFEVSRIEILHEAELSVTSNGPLHVKIEKAERKPVYSASDWNYIRFNIHTSSGIMYYEMIDSDLYQVML